MAAKSPTRKAHGWIEEVTHWRCRGRHVTAESSRREALGSWLLDGGRQRVGRLEFSLGTSVIAQWNRSEDAKAIVSPSYAYTILFVSEFALF